MLSLGQARALQLSAQGLLQPLRRRPRRGDVVTAIERMRLLQIDTIHVVARSPYLVLHSRLGDYPATWLDEALEEGRLAECWAHEACFVSAADVAWHRGTHGHRNHHWAYRNAARTHREHRADMEALLQGIRSSGPVRAADFARSDGVAKPGWWEWKPEKRWLEAWFALGELMVARRDNFQRVYDLAGNVLARLDPPFDPALMPAAAELRRRFVVDGVRALGVTQAGWIADYFRLRPKVSDRELAPLVASGELLAVPVQGWNVPGYVHCDHAEALGKALAGRLRATHTALLSPFDPLVWDRARVRAMFGFEYTIECYTPAPKRRYGYYVLPILHRGRLVGRLDAKAHRGIGVFEVKALFLEAGVAPEPSLVRAVAAAIAGTARWHGTPEIRLDRTDPAALARPLRAALKHA
ncbi:winged helix-turn-helix domain-containing protein [Rhodanobacter denitrificans]|uniref:Winged helix-turn-helix domain-containing protein n=1 Tax=Rhodanobacter denitrificans TaxID=666685 RepID=A0A368KFC9_9GAMM|nr:crosslink repair DNA glycosylase YcaQ family protein [Rhodanobacter denitrificans]RCS30547.1 winged helix-turn-helix domain-containing protein [Rhodanobacter denitrificans]